MEERMISGRGIRELIEKAFKEIRDGHNLDLYPTIGEEHHLDGEVRYITGPEVRSLSSQNLWMLYFALQKENIESDTWIKTSVENELIKRTGTDYVEVNKDETPFKEVVFSLLSGYHDTPKLNYSANTISGFFNRVREDKEEYMENNNKEITAHINTDCVDKALDNVKEQLKEIIADAKKRDDRYLCILKIKIEVPED